MDVPLPVGGPPFITTLDHKSLGGAASRDAPETERVCATSRVRGAPHLRARSTPDPRIGPVALAPGMSHSRERSLSALGRSAS
jgi:hypothetical protein